MKITIPTSLADITLKQYKHFLKIEKGQTESKFYSAKMIEIFCNMPFEKVILLKVKDSQEIIDLLSDMFETKPMLVRKFKIDKIEYGFHPELDELTLGEYIDLDTFISDWDNMEKAMNVLYRPIIAGYKEKYAIKDYELGTEEKLLNMPMDAVMSSIFFLWNLGIDLSKTMTNSFQEEGKNKQALTQYLTSQKNGVGISQFMGSLKEILQDLKISQN
tara:strand:+ start:7143 stop:7793 length:651 start_codon:yes stop_codon:yes gene_type:complete